MIADDRGSQIAESSAIIWKHTSAIACDPAIVIAEDRTLFYLLRSSAIVCDPAIIWKPTFNSKVRKSSWISIKLYQFLSVVTIVA